MASRHYFHLRRASPLPLSLQHVSPLLLIRRSLQRRPHVALLELVEIVVVG